MSPQTPTAAWRRLAGSMALGAGYDLAFAGAILLFAESAGRLMGLPVPDDRVYLRLNGIFLVLVAATYLLAAWQPRRYVGVVWVAIGGRSLGGVYLAVAWAADRPGAFLLLACGDLGFAVLHAVLLRAAWRGDAAASP